MHRDVRSHRRPTALLAASIAALLVAGVLALTVGGASASVSTQLQTARDTLANCQLLAANSAGAQRTRAQLCVTDQTRIIALLTVTPSPSGSSTSPPTATPTGTPTVPPTTVPPTTVPATAPPVTTTPPGPGACPAFPAFPDASCTGYAHTGVTLKTCVQGDGDETDEHLERANAVYDGCLFPQGVVIQAAGITISRSWIKGNVRVHDSLNHNYGGMKLVDVEIGPSSDPDFAAVSAGNNWSCLRCNAHGTATGLHIGNNVSVVDSFSHDFADTGSHGAAAGTGQGAGDHTVFLHDNLQCNRTDGAIACSAALALYDEPTLNDVLVQNTLMNSISGFCAYGGNTGTNIRFIDNRFGMLYHHECGLFGPITVFNPNPGNVWSGNLFTDGRVVNP